MSEDQTKSEWDPRLDPRPISEKLSDPDCPVTTEDTYSSPSTIVKPTRRQSRASQRAKSKILAEYSNGVDAVIREPETGRILTESERSLRAAEGAQEENN